MRVVVTENRPLDGGRLSDSPCCVAEATAILPQRRSSGKSSRLAASGRPVEHILTLLEDVRESANGWQARCPAHQDNNPSLSIAEGADGRVLLHCFAGCRPQEIVGALGMTLADLFPRDSAPGRSRRLRRRRGLSEADAWQRFKALRRSLRVQLAHLIREVEREAGRAGPALFDNDELAARVRQLGRWEWLFERLLGEGSPQEQLWAVLWAREEVAAWARQR